MKTYADSSFIVKLLNRESGSDEAMAEYRRRGLPRLVFLPLHALEVDNAVHHRAFHELRTPPSGQRSRVQRERLAALSRLSLLLRRGQFVEIDADCEDAFRHARVLSQKYTATHGTRSLDLLHVAFALQLKCDLFLTRDQNQSRVAKAEGFAVAGPFD